MSVSIPSFGSIRGNVDGAIAAYDRAMERVAELHEPNKVDVPEGTSGPWTVDKFEVTRGMEAMRLWREGRPCPPGTYTRLSGPGGSPFMSDTPAEMHDLSGFLWRSEGDVLITGLGLGMAIKALLKKPEVTTITVIEREPDVIRLVAPTYENARVSILQDDAFTWDPGPLRFDWAWHDIWAKIGRRINQEGGVLRNRYKRAMRAPGRQMLWCEHLAKRY